MTTQAGTPKSVTAPAPEANQWWFFCVLIVLLKFFLLALDPLPKAVHWRFGLLYFHGSGRLDP